MTSGSEVPPANTPLSTINMSSPLPLQDWNQAFMLSTPVRPTSRHTPSKTNWNLGTAQRTPQARTPAPLRTPTLSTRRVQQGASLASTPAQSGQRVMPRSKTSDLIAPSLANLPNALDADYWLKKVQIQEQLGMYKAAVDLFELAVKRDVRPATTISRAYGEFLMRHNLPGPTGTTNATVPPSATRRTQDEEQENSASQNIISPTKFTATKPKRKGPPARRQSHGSTDHARGTDLSSLMARLLSPEPDAQDETVGPIEDDNQVDSEDVMIDCGSAEALLPGRPGSLLSSTLSPETGAIHLTPAVLHGATTALQGDASDATCTPGDGAGLYAIDPLTAVTPLCLDLDSLQISGASSRPAAFTPASPTNEDDAAATSEAYIPFSLPRGLSSVQDTPALQGLRMGWNRSVFDTTGDAMSPELLGWHEKQGLDEALIMEPTRGSTPSEAEPELPAASFQFSRTPASVMKSKPAAESSALGKAVRVKTPANRRRVGKSELKGLAGNSPPRKAQDMGSIALLSPVRADGRLTNQLGAAKVVTPVRRSARKSLATPLIASMLRETEFAYAPNEALPRRRPSMFESPTPYADNAAASVQDDDDGNDSTPTSITGVSLTGDLSIPAESPVLQAEASAATYSSSRLSSQSVSPVPVTPPDASALLEAALSPDMAVDTMAFYGALHQLHAESSLTAGNEEGLSQVGIYTETEVTNADTAAGLVTPPPTAQDKLSPQGPTTRSKSARKGLPLLFPASAGPRRKRIVDSPSLSPTEVKIRDGLRRSARLQRESKNSAP
ncbi:hypothetical protein WJX79_001912 [Trebouxia sp. C0005]